MPVGSTHASRDIYQRLAVNEVTSLQQNTKTVRDMQGLQPNYLKSGKLTSSFALIIISILTQSHLEIISITSLYSHFTIGKKY